MTVIDDIYATAARYADAGEGEQTLLRQLCAAAQHRLEADLLRGVTPEQCYDSFVCAAALLAAADFSAVAAGSGVRSFSAGPVTVTKDDGRRARELRQQAALLMAPWCQGAFRFLGVAP